MERNQAPALDWKAQDRGILSWIGSDIIPNRAMLPQAGPGQPRFLTLDRQHPHYGPLRFTFQLFHTRHHKSSHWFWVPCRAEQLDPAAPKPGEGLADGMEIDWRGKPVPKGTAVNRNHLQKME